MIENDTCLDEIDRKIVQILQDDFPMVERPWKEVGDKLNITEEDVINRLKRLNELGVTRKIGSIVDASKVGLTAATLVAMKVPKNKVEVVACAINEYGAVSHNYEREHEYNVWFTITASSKNELTTTLEEISQRTGINPDDVLNLPTKRRFKINVRFQLT
jgi:DNA-binding Lrp family transcriptional regulator